MSKGFTNWDRRDYQRFCQAIDLFPRDDYENFALHIGTKTGEEIKEYMAVFFANLSALTESQKIQKNL